MLPNRKSADSPRKKKSSSTSADLLSLIASLESDESQVMTGEEANPYGKVQLIRKTLTGMSSSTINTSSVHGEMDNVLITFSYGSNSTEGDSENSRGSRRQREVLAGNGTFQKAKRAEMNAHHLSLLIPLQLQTELL